MELRDKTRHPFLGSSSLRNCSFCPVAAATIETLVLSEIRIEKF
jgi:hypothetical protein